MTPIVAVSSVPQARSTAVMIGGQLRRVAWLVRSYVAYATRPNSAPRQSAAPTEPESTPGRTTKTVVPIA